MKLSAIVAVSNNMAIGVDNDLPWHMPADLKFFKDTTRGHHVLMGRKSFDSIGRPLPGRTNIVVTRNKDFYHSGVQIAHSIVDGIRKAQDAGVEELFILGGSNIYGQTKDLWDVLYMTRIDTEIGHATAFFPEIDMRHWALKSEEKYIADEKNAFDYSFNMYVRPNSNTNI